MLKSQSPVTSLQANPRSHPGSHFSCSAANQGLEGRLSFNDPNHMSWLTSLWLAGFCPSDWNHGCYVGADDFTVWLERNSSGVCPAERRPAWLALRDRDRNDGKNLSETSTVLFFWRIVTLFSWQFSTLCPKMLVTVMHLGVLLLHLEFYNSQWWLLLHSHYCNTIVF